MIYEFSSLKAEQSYNIVIIGSGPAGITLANGLSDFGVSSLNLEAGGLEFTDIAQETCTGSVIGDEYWELETTHLKYFGGTSNHWTGVCRPLDEIDFEKRSDISGHIGWPISKSDLDPYFEEAKTILEVAQLREAPINQYIKE